MSNLKPYPQKLWVVLDYSGTVMHHTTDENIVSVMFDHVREVNAKGMEWSLVEFKLSEVLGGSLSTSLQFKQSSGG